VLEDMTTPNVVEVFSCGSKTFLIGEYSAIFGGSAILLITDPQFSLEIIPNGITQLIGAGKNLPVIKFYHQYREVFEGLSITFTNSFRKYGGFGTSSAQFSLLYKLFLRRTNNKFNILDFLEEYRQLYYENRIAHQIQPSGADCLAQYCNHHIYFDSTSNYLEPIECNFSDIGMVIFKTGFKIFTHEHLRNIANETIADSAKRQLRQIVSDALDCFKKGSGEMLAHCINEFFSFLNEMGFVDARSLDLAKKIMQIDGVIAAKGCGSMCLDTILVIYRKNHSECLRVISAYCSEKIDVN
jgi:mevalonate kinase